MIRFVAIIVLITVHMIDGRKVEINPKQIVSLSEVRDKGDPKKQYADDVRCVLSLTDGKYLSVAETCSQVRALIGETDAE